MDVLPKPDCWQAAVRSVTALSGNFAVGRLATNFEARIVSTYSVHSGA